MEYLNGSCAVAGPPQRIFYWVGQAYEKRYMPKRFSKE